MSRLADIADALSESLQTVPGLATFAAPEGASPPWAFVSPPTDIDYQRTFGGNGIHRAELDVYVLVAAAGAFNGAAVSLLWGYMDVDGPESIRAAVLTDPTLGGLVEGLSVPSCRVLTNEEVAGIGFVGAVWSVPLHWRDA